MVTKLLYLRDTFDYINVEPVDFDNKPKAKCRQTHNYYQWVPYMLVFQGVLFMLPNRIWRILEEGKMKCIAKGVTTGNKG